MARIDFYQLSRDPIERVVPLLATKALAGGGRLLVVSHDPSQRAALAEALWSREGEFLANGEADESCPDRQPVLLAADCQATNGAAMAILADGEWREEATAFDRTILLFGPGQTDAARGLWARLSGEDHSLRIFKQGDSGGWREGR